MNNFFRRLSLPVKLLLLILFPLVLITFLAFAVYREKSEKAELLDSYLGRINTSADISDLISSLQSERKFSYNYVLTNDGDSRNRLGRLRLAADSTLKKLAERDDITLKQFTSYTFLDSLEAMRRKIDQGRTSADMVMHYYTTAIFRLHTLNIVLAGNNKYLDPIFGDLTTEKILNEMITYLEILSANFYNALYTKQNNIAMLYGSLGVYDVYKSYEKEFLVKASPALAARYATLRNTTALKPANEYINHIFKRFSFDTLYNAEEWWQVSGAASDHLKVLKKDILQSVKTEMSRIHAREIKNRDITLFGIVIALVFVFALMVYTTHVITQMLTDINAAAQKIARGNTGVSIRNISNDVIGSLGDSIVKIDKNNRALADAANSIGKGDFDVPIPARSEYDMLGNAVLRMRDDLQRFTAAIEKSKEQFREVADKAPVMIWMSGTDKLCTFFNKGWLNFTGRTLEQELGSGWTTGIHPDDYAHCMEMYGSSFEAHHDFYLEYRMKRYDGQYRWVGDTGAPRYSPGGEFEGYIGSCIDIHEMKLLEQRKDDFIKMASHELKTPVTTIKGYIQLLRKMHDNDKDPFLSDSLATLDKQVSKLTRLITDLLDATRMETGKLLINKEVFRLSEIITALVNDARSIFPSRTILLHQHSDPVILADKDRMTQVFSNLLDNAIKYSPPASGIIVDIGTATENAIVSVSDSGIGIAPEDKDKIFERFYRAPGKQESTFPGFGIGLFIVKEIITLHKGEVWVDSEKGKGAVFYVSLPVYHGQV
jgi:PAS domain S-box-containing protein